MAGYERLAELAARERDDGDGESGNDDDDALGECERCGSTTSSDVCRKCRLVESIRAA